MTVLGAAALAAGCGGEDPAPAPARDKVVAARTPQECFDLWNVNAHLGSAGQKSPEDYLAELAAERTTPVLVTYFRGECLVVAPRPKRPGWAYVWVARKGRAPYGHPSQMDLTGGGKLKFNARATTQGRLKAI